MKKINLILCAAAVACVGFFVSCSNGATEITFVNQTTTKNLYSVTGSVTTIEADKTVTSGVAAPPFPAAPGVPAELPHPASTPADIAATSAVDRIFDVVFFIFLSFSSL